MARPVKFRIREGVAIVTLAAPPANAISAEVRAGLWDVFGRINANTDARSAILIAEGGLFSGGADIRDLAHKEAEPSLAAVCQRIETCRVPVVAGLHGAALGAGADLALSCHYRLAEGEASFGLPEVTLGLVPSGGATQRLPRLVGAETALDILLSGRPLPATAARAAGLLDGIVDGHLHTGTWTYAKSLADQSAVPAPVSERRDGISDGLSFMAAITERRGAVSAGRLHAPKRVLDCVEAALLLPFEAGLAMETDAADRCRSHPQSAALRHAYIAESRISADLLALQNGARRVTDPNGAAVVSRLRHVMGAVAEHLREAGHGPETIDAALIDYGFVRTPYEGRTGGAGAAGAGIARRFVAALMVEGARQMSNGKVARASDIDALAIHGAGFPRVRGGPMQAAQLMGLLGLRKDLEVWSGESPLWQVPALLLEAIKTADGFDAIGVRAVA